MTNNKLNINFYIKTEHINKTNSLFTGKVTKGQTLPYVSRKE